MANHFRSSERQGDRGDASSAPQAPAQRQGDGSMLDDELEAAMAAVRSSASSAGTAPISEPEFISAAGPDVRPTGDAGATDVRPAGDGSFDLADESTALQVADDDSSLDVQDDKSVFSPMIAGDAPTIDRTGTPTISLRNATLIYPAQPNKPALEDVSLDIYPGEFVFVVGHSGSGKSTFLKLVTRELRATSGQVIVAGQNLTKLRNRKVPYLRRQIGTVYQDFKLLPDKTVYENVAFALECIGKPRSVVKVQVPEVLRLVGLAEKMDNYPDQLSGGEQQRVSVARAMVNRPPLLVCDEPTGNLDPAISLGIMKLLDRINRAGTTVVMATHDREMVDSMRKRVIALEAGHIVRDQERGGYGYYGAL